MPEKSVRVNLEVINRIAKPTFVIGLDRRAHTCNRAGKVMLADPLSPLQSTNGYVRGIDTAVDKAIAFQAFAVSQWPDSVFEDQYSPIAAPMRTHWVAISVSCLQNSSSGLPRTGTRYLLLTVHPVHTHCQVEPALLQAALGLSRSEAKVSALIYAGLSLREAALQMEIGHATAKTYLQGVFAKTRISKQTELVRLVASLS
jgi:DNA-binding CsgD family transcriptional regulator